MENIGAIIWVVVVIIGIVARANKKGSSTQNQNQQKTQDMQNQKNWNSQQNYQKNTANSTLQSQLNRAFSQINEIKNIATEQINNQQQNYKSAQTPPRTNTVPKYNPSLEGHQMEGHQVEGYQMEGHKVEGYKVEGHKVEGIKQKHNTKKFDKNKRAVTESSMKRGYAGEGCDEHYDMDIAYTKIVGKKAKKQSLHFSDNPIVQGIVMAQILERPRTRR